MNENALAMILVLAAIFLSLYAQLKVQMTYSKYSKVANRMGISGVELAQDVLNRNGYDDISLRAGGGVLSDHFDPRTKTISLSPTIYNGKSIASLAIAAHECGHVIQHQSQYAALTLRNKLLPSAIVASNLGWLAILIGLSTGILSLFYLGLILMAIIALFQVVTLPIEFDASKRALSLLKDNGYIVNEEVGAAKKLLDAAALTYIAALVGTILNIIRLLALTRRRG